MPKKDTAAAVAAMLSTAGAQTRRIPERTEPAAPAHVASVPTAVAGVTVTEPPPATVSTLPPPIVPAPAPIPEAPRTLRLQPSTAQRLRDAWLEAKRDDVLLTAQDFASALVDDALAQRGRSRSLNRG